MGAPLMYHPCKERTRLVDEVLTSTAVFLSAKNLILVYMCGLFCNKKEYAPHGWEQILQ